MSVLMRKVFSNKKKAALQFLRKLALIKIKMALRLETTPRRG